MCSDNTTITVKGIGKRYQIYRHPQDRLKQSLLPRLQRTIGISEKRYFREFEALKNISFSIKSGETVGIIGSNGSGKSTLLQIICGTLTPSSGDVSTQGQIAALLELGTGFNPEFSGLENVYLYAQVLGLSTDKIEQILPTILEFADIGEFIHQPVKTYSSGMVVRLAFSVSVVREPDILVVDEALAVGDEAFQRKCYARIEELKKQGTTILFVSHGANIIISLCDRALLLDRGELLFDGTPKEAVTLYHKLTFAPRQSRADVRKEIKAIDPTSEKTNHIDINDAPTEEEQPQYINGMLSKSRIEYEQQGATIIDPHIETLKGKRVNLLIPMQEYKYCYKVRFLQSANSVQFGMLIKNITGVELSGALHPSIVERIEHIKINNEYKVNFNFLCQMNPGVYFLNAGVQGIKKNGVERTYLHRILDAVMFRVKPYKKRSSTALINVITSSTASKLE